MARLGKCICLCFFVILAVSSAMIIPLRAETIPKPSVPEFTLDLSDVSLVKITITNQPVVVMIIPILPANLYSRLDMD